MTAYCNLETIIKFEIKLVDLLIESQKLCVYKNVLTVLRSNVSGPPYI
jgi:hypothetical protein